MDTQAGRQTSSLLTDFIMNHLEEEGVNNLQSVLFLHFSSHLNTDASLNIQLLI